MVVKYRELQEDIQPFLLDIPITVAISVLSVEWRNSNGQNLDGVFILKQVSLMLSYYFTIHKSQGKTLDRPVVNLGESEKCNGTTLVALSCVRKISHLLLKPFSFKGPTKANKSKYLALI